MPGDFTAAEIHCQTGVACFSWSEAAVTRLRTG